VTISLERVFLASAIVLTFALTLAAMTPLPPRAMGGVPHLAVHVAAYMVVAFAWARGLPAIPALALILGGAVLGCAHEAMEIFGHRHPFEWLDAFVDAFGVVAGVLLVRLPRRKRGLA
jgi:hypothetical protein